MKETAGIVPGYLAIMTPQLIVRTINLPLVPLSELLDGCFDVHHTALLPHRLRGIVAVRPGSIPVSINGLGVKRDHDTKVLGDPLKDIPAEEEAVSISNNAYKTSPPTWPSTGHRPW